MRKYTWPLCVAFSIPIRPGRFSFYSPPPVIYAVLLTRSNARPFSRLMIRITEKRDTLRTMTEWHGKGMRYPK
jgi:hypothetical protein